MLEQLGRHATPATEVLVEVNIAGEEGKSGIAPGELRRVPRALSGRTVVGPDDDAAARRRPRGQPPLVRRAAELAAARGLRELSMGTTQDFAVAAEEGATIVRIGTRLYR